MSDLVSRYMTVEGQNPPRPDENVPVLSADMVERTQNPARRDRESRPLDHVLGQAYNLNYYDSKFDEKLALCNQTTLRITNIPANVQISFWKDQRGYFFFFPNGQDGRKPHYLPPNVTRIETLHGTTVQGQDLAQLKPSIDQAVAAEAAKIQPPVATNPTPNPGRATPEVAPGARQGQPQGTKPAPGQYADGRSWNQPFGKNDNKPITDVEHGYGLNRTVQRGTAIASDVYFGRMAMRGLPAGSPFRSGTVGILAGGEVGKYLIDQQFFPNANPSLRTYAIDMGAPAIVLTKLPWYAKAGVILGSHLVARIWDQADSKKK